jgi:23S rRNA (cytidine1920-2'-O)/16S rRNA (cytidine1409-2'-O)-methyltransferase
VAVPKKTRLDVALVDRGLAPTRARAQSLIMARRVRVDGAWVDKPGAPVSPEATVTVDEPEHPWVGRGGMKLAGAIDHFGISVEGKVCADIGASTGGFTDVLLQGGARLVYAIDVGHGQLDPKLREDPRVVNREKTNARHLQPEEFDPVPAVATIDVSFISLRLILPAVARVLAPDGELVALVKPQFEVGKGEVGKGGIVRDEALRRSAIDGVVRFAQALGFEIAGVVDSPIRGAEGNLEALLYGRWRGADGGGHDHD